MAFSGGPINSAIAAALQQRTQVQQPQAISTGPTRSALVAQLLAQQRRQQPQRISSVGEGLARLGSRLVDTAVGKRAIDKRLDQSAAQQQALASALSQAGLPEGIAGIAQQNPQLAVALLGQQQKGAALQASTVSDQAKAAEALAKEERQRTEAREAQQRTIEASAQRQAIDISAREQAAATAVEGAAEKAADVQTAKAKAAIELERPQAQARLEGSIGQLDSTLTLLGRVSGHEGLSAATGLSSGLPTRPGSDAADFEAILETVKARLGFAELQKMREASPTGGALGAISEREITFLQAAEQSLSLSQSEEQFRDNLKEIEGSLERLAANQRKAFTAKFGEGPKALQEMTLEELRVEALK